MDFTELIDNADAIIWDWNGTLLDDVDISIRAVGHLTEKYGLGPMTEERHRRYFTFPILNYYKGLGFNTETMDFNEIAEEYHAHYMSLLPEACIRDEFIDLINTLRKRNLSQYVLSAMHESLLVESLKHYNIHSLFDGVYGLKTKTAGSKIDRGREMIEKENLNNFKRNIIMIGDTTHDAEVAKELGFIPVLIACGHQDRNKLESMSCIVVDNVGQLFA